MALSKTVKKQITAVADTRAKKVASKKKVVQTMNAPKARRPLNKDK